MAAWCYRFTGDRTLAADLAQDIFAKAYASLASFRSDSKFAAQSQALAWALHAANERYATDYPANVGPHMTNTDSVPFMDVAPAISVRENERRIHVGSGLDPKWHPPTDLYATYGDKDFLLGLNAAQTTLSAVGHLTGATLGR